MNAIIWADPAVRLKKHAELMALRADNARLRAALKEAPHPWAYPNRLSASEWDDVYHMWYASQRQAALGLADTSPVADLTGVAECGTLQP